MTKKPSKNKAAKSNLEHNATSNIDWSKRVMKDRQDLPEKNVQRRFSVPALPELLTTSGFENVMKERPIQPKTDGMIRQKVVPGIISTHQVPPEFLSHQVTQSGRNRPYQIVIIGPSKKDPRPLPPKMPRLLDDKEFQRLEETAAELKWSERPGHQEAREEPKKKWYEAMEECGFLHKESYFQTSPDEQTTLDPRNPLLTLEANKVCLSKPTSTPESSKAKPGKLWSGIPTSMMELLTPSSSAKPVASPDDSRTSSGRKARHQVSEEVRAEMERKRQRAIANVQRGHGKQPRKPNRATSRHS